MVGAQMTAWKSMYHSHWGTILYYKSLYPVARVRYTSKLKVLGVSINDDPLILMGTLWPPTE